MSKIEKPDPRGTAHFVGGYCLNVTLNTQKVDVVTPTECEKIMHGEGFFFPSEELKKFLTFGNKVCDQTKVCAPDAQKAENQKFLEFLNKPEELRKHLKEKTN